jgi:hypothetical protein
MIRIEGQWNLLAWRRVTGDGAVSYPFGEKASGMLVYTASGGMIVQMTAAGRQPLDTNDPIGGKVEDRAKAYSGCLAYFGRYEVKGEEVHHFIDGSLYPNWIGADQGRPFELTDDRLVLRTPPVEIDGVTVVNEMSWVRG